MEHLARKIQAAETICLTTHRQCDGDGLGAELALKYALKKIGKTVDVINVDATPKKYQFLHPDRHIQYFENGANVRASYDLCIIFDTNDERLLQPLWPVLKERCKTIVFLDHHPILEQGPAPTRESIIDTRAASTGELAYNLIKELGIALDRDIARAIYTSVTFDTQLYRFIRNSPTSHLIAADCLTYQIDPEEVHRALFSNQTVQKIAFMATALARIEYHCEDKVAFLKLKAEDLTKHGMEPDESRDMIDLIMTIEALQAGILVREERANQYRVSFRSKGSIEVVSIAEAIGGGGHVHASGATVVGNYDELRTKILDLVSQKVQHTRKKAATGT